MTKKEEKEIFALMDATVTTVEITCSKCNETEQLMYCDDYEAAESFRGEGWKATELNVYCPTCVEKYLNKKKKNK